MYYYYVELTIETYWYKILLIIFQSINPHATYRLSRWIWAFWMVHHWTATKKICFHLQHKYICVMLSIPFHSCTYFIVRFVNTNSFGYSIIYIHIDPLQFFAGTITEDHVKAPGLANFPGMFYRIQYCILFVRGSLYITKKQCRQLED